MYCSRIRLFAYKYIAEPSARVLLSVRVTPNAVTCCGLLISVSAAYLIANGNFLPGGVLVLAGGSMDMLDGTLARISNRVSARGAFLDSVSDRLAEAAILFGLLWHFAGAMDRTGSLLVYVTLVSSLLVSYLRAKGEILGVDSRLGIMTRPGRVVVLGMGIILGDMVDGLLLLTMAMVSILSFITVGQRAINIWRDTGEQ